ncbi:MAG TPA: TolC family protein [Gemmatimonadaceae bacterium]|nr:TolC family protein [Gemmatimonadaceae bacterium]
MIVPDGVFRYVMAMLVVAAVVVPAAAPRAHAQDAGRDTVISRPLSLGDAARLAAHQSASAEEARFQAAQASAQVTQARSELLPNVSAYAMEHGVTINTATFGFALPGLDPGGELLGPVNTIDVRGKLSQTIFDYAALSRVRSARSTAVAGNATASDVAEQAAVTASLAYLRAQRADADLAAREADSVLADSLLGIANDQLTAGVGVALDVTRAQAQVAAVRAQLIAARNERDRSRLDLLRALGLSLDAHVELADTLTRLTMSDTMPNEQAAIAQALRDRPDLRAADQRLEAARQTSGAIRAERLPSLTAFADEGWLGTNSGNKLNTYQWGVQVSVPVFDGLRREGRIEEQEARVSEIDVRRRDLRQEAAIEVRGAMLDLGSAREAVDAAREQLRLTEQEVAQARDRFRAGVSGNADVITASLTLNTSRTQLVDALASYQSARVALARAVGSVTSLP